MNTIIPLNEEKIFAIPEYAFQLYREWKYPEKTEKYSFWDSCNIIEWIELFTFIEFNDKIQRDEIISNFPKATAMNQKPDENGRNIPELVGSFDDKENYYIIVYPNHSATEEINPNIWVFKGMIINPIALNKEIWEDENVKSRVNETLWNKKD